MAARPVFVFAPGAGAPITHRWFAPWIERLSREGDVHPFDYPYATRGRKAPDPLPVLIAAHLAAIAAAAERHPGQPLFLIGKSMGGRVGCHASLERAVSGLICLGYPLRAPGAAGKLRDRVLLELRTPALFVQGTRDPLCPLELLADVRKRMTAPNELYVVDAGDHSLEVTKTALKASAETQADVDARVSDVIRKFVAQYR